jgi:hypothetical protein
MQARFSLHAITRLHELHAVQWLACEWTRCHMHHAMVLHLHGVCCLRLLLLQVVHLLLWLLHVWVLLLLLLLLLVLLLLLHAHRPGVPAQARAGCHAARHLTARLLGLLHVLAVIRPSCCRCRRCTGSKTARRKQQNRG